MLYSSSQDRTDWTNPCSYDSLTLCFRVISSSEPNIRRRERVEAEHQGSGRREVQTVI